MSESLEKEITTTDKSKMAKRFQMYTGTILKLAAETENKGKKGAGK